MSNLQLAVIYRVEPGCLGPEGAAHIEGFCQFAQPLVAAHTPAFMQWQLQPNAMCVSWEKLDCRASRTVFFAARHHSR